MTEVQQAQPQQAQAQQEPRAPFYLTGGQLDVIMSGLGQLPYNIAAPVIEDLKAQYDNLVQHAQQQQAAQQSEVEGGETPEPEVTEATEETEA